uniref:Ribonuclease E n=1 Tax=Pleonosporium borreri TaxID=2575635 RepID=A0A4D6WWH5_9FLOR|nr:ribonuclease E [Pleonosporium borreri]
MIKKIVISNFNNIAAILQNNKIEEIILINHNYQVNDIYIGIVQKIFSSINAAFVKLSKYGKSGFIHIGDIQPIKKDRYINNINEVLFINQLILVQVVKEPTLNKGPRLTANINLHGRYLILMPFCNTISISDKIYDNNERSYLYSLSLLVKPDTMGIVIKQSAQGVSERSILQDLDNLKRQWYFIIKTMISACCPILVYRDEDLIQKIIRDFYEENIKKIIIDSQEGLNSLYYYLSKWNCISPITDTQLQLYNKSRCILEEFSIINTIHSALKSKVKLLYGSYIIIEHYEALTIIDVNSGSFNRSDSSREAILKTNFYAASEIAYQLKIRNINGVIVIDFIDMNSQRDQMQLLEHFNKVLNYDNAKPQIIQLSELGLVELTRRRRGQSLQEIFSSNNKYSEKNIILNKYIKSLFFTKKFKKNIYLEDKHIDCVSSNINSSYFITLDTVNYINFFSPKANHILPLIFYIYCLRFI